MQMQLQVQVQRQRYRYRQRYTDRDTDTARDTEILCLKGAERSLDHPSYLQMKTQGPEM